METKPQFDLEAAIKTWRKQIAHAAFSEDNLRELEAHLRESMAQVQQTGVSGEDAFAIASYRLGQSGPLSEEFARAHPERVWFERVLWMLLGAQIVSWLTYCATTLQGLISIPQTLLRHARSPVDAWPGGVLWLSQFLLLGALLVGAFKFLQSRRGAWEQWMEVLCHRPGKSCAVLAAVSLTAAVVSFGASMLPMLIESWWSSWTTSAGTPAPHYHFPSLFLVLSVSCLNAALIPLMIYWFLRRRGVPRVTSIDA